MLSNLEQAFSSIHLHPMLTHASAIPAIEGSVVNVHPTLAATIWRHQSESDCLLTPSSGRDPHLLH